MKPPKEKKWGNEKKEKPGVAKIKLILLVNDAAAKYARAFGPTQFFGASLIFTEITKIYPTEWYTVMCLTHECSDHTLKF